MGAHPSIGLAGYNLEFCVRFFGNCRMMNCKDINTIDRNIDADFLSFCERVLASFTGQIISIGPVVSNIGRRNDQTLRLVHLVQG